MGIVKAPFASVVALEICEPIVPPVSAKALTVAPLTGPLITLPLRVPVPEDAPGSMPSMLLPPPPHPASSNAAAAVRASGKNLERTCLRVMVISLLKE